MKQFHVFLYEFSQPWESPSSSLSKESFMTSI
jgi:hypothetical protein